MVVPTLLQEARDELGIIEKLILPDRITNFDVYYGMNVSNSLASEPVDQLDGFLLASYMQRSVNSKFYPFIAGAYRTFNSSSPEEAEKKLKRGLELDESKRKLLDRIMQNLGLCGQIYTTKDLWQTSDYWEIFSQVLSRLNPEEATCFKNAMPANQFPIDLLRGLREYCDERLLDGWSSPSLYIPAEVAEAIWFRKNLGISFKTGPGKSEEIYDKTIREYGIGIIGLTQPRYRERARIGADGDLIAPRIRDVVPYIGRKGQNRILFSDNLGDVVMKAANDNPSFQRALTLTNICEKLDGKQGSGSPARRIFENLIRLGGKDED